MPTAALVLCCLAGAVPAIAVAQPILTPASYFKCQIAAREATLAGMAERAVLLRKRASDLEQRQSDDRTRDRVSAALAACGYGLNALAAYAHRHREGLVAWLAANPRVQAQLDDLTRRMSALSAEVSAPQAPSRQRVPPAAQRGS